MPTLERAIAIAVAAHAGQVDKNGRAYMSHPLRVLAAFQHEVGPDADALRMIAVLHDVVEDAPAWPLERLRDEGFAPEVIAAVDHLTRRESESYEAFVERALEHPLARRVKQADLRDNMDITRLRALDDKAIEWLRRYHAAWQRLAQE